MSGSARPVLTAVIVAALVGDATLTTLLGGAKVWVNVPDNTHHPYLWVVGGREVPIEPTFARKSRRLVQVLVTAVSSQRGTAEVDSLTSRVIDVMAPDGTPGPAVTGFNDVWEFVENREPKQMEDQVDGAVVWMGTAVFNVPLL